MTRLLHIKQITTVWTIVTLLWTIEIIIESSDKLFIAIELIIECRNKRNGQKNLLKIANVFQFWRKASYSKDTTEKTENSI